jgi:transposase
MWKLPAAQRKRIQMVLLRETGMTRPEIAEAMGVSFSTVNRANVAYDEGGIKALKPKPIGDRQRENMTLPEEKALLAQFAKAAGAGELLNVQGLKAAYEQAIAHPTSSLQRLPDRRDAEHPRSQGGLCTGDRASDQQLHDPHPSEPDGWHKLMPRLFIPIPTLRLKTQ